MHRQFLLVCTLLATTACPSAFEPANPPCEDDLGCTTAVLGEEFADHVCRNGRCYPLASAPAVIDGGSLDGGAPNDSGNTTIDAGATQRDAAPLADAGSPQRDAAPVNDAGRPRRDAATPAPDTGPPAPGECNASSVLAVGQLGTDVVAINYDGETVQATAEHSMSADAVNDGCLASIELVYTLFEGRGCRLTLNLSSEQGSRLLLRSAELQADGFCPNWPVERRGTYTMLAGEGAGSLAPPVRVAGRLADESCTALQRTLLVGGATLGLGGQRLRVQLSELGIGGALASRGNIDRLCASGPSCGDNVVDDGEECDDLTDRCHNCRNVICGNDRIDHGESCEDGNNDEFDNCVNCRVYNCDNYNGRGHNSRHAGSEQRCDQNTPCPNNETCNPFQRGGDVGICHPWAGFIECEPNQVQGDYCLLTCLRARCGDGEVWEGAEECDDGNLDNGDGCNAQCMRED